MNGNNLCKWVNWTIAISAVALGIHCPCTFYVYKSNLIDHESIGNYAQRMSVISQDKGNFIRVQYWASIGDLNRHWQLEDDDQ